MIHLVDVTLVVTLLACAWLSLTGRDLLRSVVLFIAFGLLVSLGWARLRAPDVALAEAAVGSGLTGALLLSAFSAMERARLTTDEVGLTRARWLALGLTLGLGVSLGVVLLSLPSDHPRLSLHIQERISQSGVLNSVTAVLLNFRSYDTLLEMVVLLASLVGIWAVAPFARVWPKAPSTPILAALARLLLPLMTVVAGYLLWLGADAPGGAFQAGAVLGGMGVLWVAASLWHPPWALRMVRPLLVLGLLAFLAVAGVTMGIGKSMLEYPASQAKTLILWIETAATVSIGVTLTLLFLGGYPAPPEQS